MQSIDALTMAELVVARQFNPAAGVERAETPTLPAFSCATYEQDAPLAPLFSFRRAPNNGGSKLSKNQSGV